jgi:DNA (cytosine-5)-methyltransferase 1
MAHLLCSADYGVPQIRHRAIIMASKDQPISLPIPTHYPSEKHLKNNTVKKENRGNLKNTWTTVHDAINDLPPKPIGTQIRENENLTLRLHFGRNPTSISLERYKTIPYGGNRFDLQRKREDITPECWIKKGSGGTDLFGRLWWEKPSVTIRTEFFKPEKGRYLHPKEHRPITHREAARLQSFPDSFEFKGSKIEIAKQIGNAVPPLMAHAIAKEVVKSLQSKTSTDHMRKTVEFFDNISGKPIKDVWYGP